jgi:hypothetical protein
MTVTWLLNYINIRIIRLSKHKNIKRYQLLYGLNTKHNIPNIPLKSPPKACAGGSTPLRCTNYSDCRVVTTATIQPPHLEFTEIFDDLCFLLFFYTVILVNCHHKFLHKLTTYYIIILGIIHKQTKWISKNK